MKSYATTHIGRHRENNQDCVDLVKKDNMTFAILCDGMGGESGGSIASSMCIKFLTNAFVNEFKKEYDVDNWLKHTIIRANDDILKFASINPKLLGMGTTLVCLLVMDDTCFYASVGDSRLYSYNKKEIKQLSEDQTLVATLLRGGYISEQEAVNHPKRSLLLSAVGSSTSDQLDIQIRKVSLEENFLLCSDGLYNMLDKGEIFKILKEDEEISEKTQRLISRANENGGYDNIGIILLEGLK